MKNFIKFLYILVIVLPQCIYSQLSTVNTTSDFNDRITSDDKTTKINLFDIEYNGEKIPLNLIYDHSGVRVTEDFGELGFGWEIQNIGFIQNIVNDNLDYETGKGWFSSPGNPSNFYDESESGVCYTGPECGVSSYSYYGGDFSPDFYSVSSANGLNFDFLFENIQSYPYILRNIENYKIELHPENFQSTPTSLNQGTVFKITDAKGNNYDFINGIKITSQNQLSRGGSYRNNFYLQSLTNPSSHNDFINLEYNEFGSGSIYTGLFFTGFNNYNSSNPTSLESQDYTNDILNNVMQIYEGEDNSKNVISKITTKNRIIDFEYNQAKLLERITINDAEYNYIETYEFTYLSLVNNYLLQKIAKANYQNYFYEVLYQFEYFDNVDPTSIPDVQDRLDYFGYFNNSIPTGNKFPFQVRNQDNTISNAANLNPDLFYAKQLSLKKITNKFGGTVDFNYHLNMGTCLGENVSMFYGGGLVLDSKIYTPNIGKKKKIEYIYSDLNGKVVNINNPKIHYVKEIDNKKFWTSKIELINTETLVPQDSTYINHTVLRGNFFKKMTIKNYDFDTNTLESQKVLRFVPEYEGFNFSPKLKNETLYDSNYNLVKETEYSYDRLNSYEMGSARITQLSSYFSGSNKFYAEKKYFPIYLNINNLKNVTSVSHDGGKKMYNIFNYHYFTLTDVEMVTEKTSQGDYFKTVYTYPHSNNIDIQNEPFHAELIQNNILSPLKIERYLNNDKLFEEKTVYDVPILGLLLPKFKYLKKETGSNNPLLKTMSYDQYDEAGNLLQFTELESKTTSLIWGYKKSKLIAKIENIQYANIPANLITSIQTASDTGNETQVLSAINSLRNHASLQNSMITSFTYNNRLDISTTTDVKGVITYYNYNPDGTLLNMKDSSGNLIMEKQNHFTN